MLYVSCGCPNYPVPTADTYGKHMLHGGIHKSCCVPILITTFHHNYITLNQKETYLGALSTSQVLSCVA